MNVSEQVGFLDDAVKGHVKVQLMEKDKVVQEVEGDNFASNSITRWLLGLLLSSFYDFACVETGDYGSSSAKSFFCETIGRFVITDNTSPVATTESVMPGNRLGYVDARPYSGSAIDRGTVNVSESKLLPDRKTIRIVMDFSTNAANGTFQTLGFVSRNDLNQPNYTKLRPLLPFVLPASGAGALSCDATDGIAIRRESASSLSIYFSNGDYVIRNFSDVSFDYCCVFGSAAWLLNKTTRQVWTLNVNSSSEPELLGTVSALPSSPYISIASNGEHLFILGTESNSRTFNISAYSLPGLSVARSQINANALYVNSFINPAALYVSSGITYLTEAQGTRLNLSGFLNLGTAASLDVTDIGAFVNSGSSGRAIGVDSAGAKYSTASRRKTFFSSNRLSGSVNEWSDFYKETDFELINLGTCVVLPTPVTKTSEQTMKITYELTFNFK